MRIPNTGREPGLKLVTETDFFDAIHSNNAITFDAQTSEQERTIQSVWIAKAAEDSLPIRLSGAKLEGPLVLDTLHIPNSLELLSCEIPALTARYATFDKWVRIQSCVLTGNCSFQGSRFQSAVWLTQTRFLGYLDLAYVSVSVDLDLDEIHCADKVNLLGATVNKNVHCRLATLNGHLLMALATVGGQFDIRKAQFLAGVTLVDARLGGLVALEARFEPPKNDEILFDRMTVASAINFAGSTFGGSVSFGGIDVKGQIIFEGVHFKGDCRLEGASANDAFFRSVTFEANVSLIGSSLFSADFSQSTFKGAARFNDLRVEVAMSLNGTTFESDAHFDRLRVGEALRLVATDRRVTFRGLVTSFAGSKIGSQGTFEDVSFEGNAIFEGMEVGADLYVERCSIAKVMSFVAASCKGNASFIAVDLARIDCHAFQIGGNCGFANCGFKDIADFSYVTTGGNLVFDACSFSNELLLKNAAIRGELRLRTSSLSAPLTLEMASCGTLDFFNGMVECAKDKKPDLSKIPINAVGLRYKQLFCVWRDYVSGLTASRLYIVDPYSQLEAYLRRSGAYHWADEVYLLGQKNLRRAFAKTSLRYWWNVALEKLSGYGLKPGRTVLALLALLGLTTLLIATIHGFATPGGEADCGKIRLPDLEVAASLAVRQYVVGSNEAVSGWTISQCPLIGSWVRPYSIIGILRLLGLVLIPFVIASFAGILKYVGHRDA